MEVVSSTCSLLGLSCVSARCLYDATPFIAVFTCCLCRLFNANTIYCSQCLLFNATPFIGVCIWLPMPLSLMQHPFIPEKVVFLTSFLIVITKSGKKDPSSQPQQQSAMHDGQAISTVTQWTMSEFLQIRSESVRNLLLLKTSKVLQKCILEIY